MFYKNEKELLLMTKNSLKKITKERSLWITYLSWQARNLSQRRKTYKNPTLTQTKIQKYPMRKQSNQYTLIIKYYKVNTNSLKLEIREKLMRNWGNLLRIKGLLDPRY